MILTSIKYFKNVFNPFSHDKNKSPLVKNMATELRQMLWIQPSCFNCRIQASIHGNPVLPLKCKKKKLKNKQMIQSLILFCSILHFPIYQIKANLANNPMEF